MTVDDSPYLRLLDRTPMDIKSNPVQIAGSTTPNYCYSIQPLIYIQNEIMQITLLVSRDFDHTITLGRDFAQKFQIGISIPDRRVYFQSIPASIGTKTVSTTSSRRKTKSRKTRTKNSENPSKRSRNKEIRARGHHNITALE